MKYKPAHGLLLAYIILFALCAIQPYDRDVWLVENIPVVLIVGILCVSYRSFAFSTVSYCWMAIFICMHTIGGHYTFERVPFDFVSETFGFERNHYDRVAHFSVGFYAYALAELLLKRRLVTTVWLLYLFPIFAIITIAGLYEVFEWWYAGAAESLEDGMAVLGSQGDIWDAQRDILSDTLGALFVMIFFTFAYKKDFSQLRRQDNDS
jgi:putative membrane protein